MINLENSSSPQLRLIHEIDRGCVERDVDILAKALHNEFSHIVYPRSLGAPVESKEEWLRKIEHALSTPIKFNKGTYHSVVETPGKVVLHATHRVDGLPGVGSRDSESIWIIEIVEECGSLKMKQVEQFTDSANYNDLSKVATAAGK